MRCLSLFMLGLGLIKQPQKLTPKKRIRRLNHGAFPHIRSSINKISQSNISLCLSIDRLDILAILLLGLLAVEKGELVLIQGQVASRNITMDYFLHKIYRTFYTSYCNALWYSLRAYWYFFYEYSLFPYNFISYAFYLFG